MQRRSSAVQRNQRDRGEVAALRALADHRRIGLPRGERVVIGTGPGCDVVLDDPGVSSIHCALEQPEPGQVLVRDQGSVRGTYLNGRRIEDEPLPPGALLRVGATEFVALGPRHGPPVSAFECLIGDAPEFRRAVETAVHAATTECSVLVLGETGTGKELIARAIHEASPRYQGPLVAVNCGAISSQLIGSELFGHEKGAFTGADVAREGMFVHAAGGTLFLDELGELPLDQQPHLLRALETRRVRPIGTNRERPIDVRLVAATNRIDRFGSDRARLREDLYHRVATVVVDLPPLRARLDDVPLLVRAFMDEFSADFGHRVIARTTLRALTDHPWPGNVRELRYAVQRAMALCPYELTLDRLLPSRLSGARARPASPGASVARQPTPAAAAPEPEPTPPRPLAPFDRMMRDQMLDALDRCGSLRRAARFLGVPKSTFADRAKRLGIVGDRLIGAE